MDNQGFLSFNNNSPAPVQEHMSGSDISSTRDIFTEIFGSIYGIKNLSYLKESYQYFDKYGAQRRIDYAIFLQRKKVAVLFEDNFNSVREEYRAGDRKIVETSLISQGWELFFWSSSGKEDLIRRNTSRDLQKIMGRVPKFTDHMDNGSAVRTKAPKESKALVTPVLGIMAIIGASILFPTISDELLSYTKLSDSKPKQESMMGRGNRLTPSVSMKNNWKDKFVDVNERNSSHDRPIDDINEVDRDETLEIDPDDF